MRRALAAALAAVAVAGCGGAGEGEPADRFLPGSTRAGAGGGLNQVPAASCEQWNAGSPRQRDRALDDIEAAFSRGGKGAVLPRERALRAFEQACGLSFAGPWKLWKIYEKALAFQYR